MAPLAGVLAALLLAAGSLTPGLAQEEEPLDVTVEIDPPTATVGDLVTIRALVDHQSDVIVTARPPSVGNADLVDAPLPQTETRPDGTERTTIEFVLQPFALGAIDVDALVLEWLREDSVGGTVTVESPALEVAPVRAPGDRELRPLRPQMEVPGAPPAWVQPAVAAGVAALSLSALLIAGVIAWRRWRQDQPVLDAGPGPEERARATLDALAGYRLETEEDFEHYYGTISLAVRRYLEERFVFNATALTTMQLSERMTREGVGRWQARLVEGLLQRCDASVYARRYPDPASADHDLTVAYEIVELSRPRVPEAEEEAVPA